MIAIYAQDLESAQKIANYHRIPDAFWKFRHVGDKIKGHEFNGVVINELQSDKTIEFLLSQKEDK